VRRYRTMESPVGTLTIAGDGGTVTNLRMTDQRHPPRGLDSWEPDPSAFDDVVAQLDEYFAGERTRFDLPLRLEGTEFQRRVWDALLDIPFGETRTYGDLARSLGSPGSARAVGLANGKNPVGIIVPCHRVVGSTGALVGYGGGLDRKRALLDHERGGQLQLLA
jgi:methylated-DNA-[protein]-cysteine S-methyltransferase